MAGATHPFFGNQYTDGNYKIGSFKFPEGLTREVGERLAKVAAQDSIHAKTVSIPSIHTSASLDSIGKTETKNKWVFLTIILAAVAAAGSYFAYRYFKKKGLMKVPNVGVCEHCGTPLTGAKFISDAEKPYIVCKKCGENNYARYHDETSTACSGE